MTIHLPNDLESSVQSAVLNGRFASVDDAMAEAVRLLLREMNQAPSATPAADAGDSGMGLIGSLRDAAAQLDEIAAVKRQAFAAGHGANGSGQPKPIWERILERTSAIPKEEWDRLPTDLAEQHDHYLYGSPKRPTA